MEKKYYTAAEFLAAQRAAAKPAKGVDPLVAAREVAEEKRSVDQKLWDAIESEGMTWQQFDELIAEFRKMFALKAAVADGDRALEPELERLLTKLDPEYQELAKERATAAKHAQDLKNRVAHNEREEGLLKNKLQNKTVYDPISGEMLRSNNDFAWIERKIGEFNAELFQLRRISEAAQNRYEQIRDNCIRYLRSDDLIAVQGFDAAIVSVIEQEIQENEARIDKSKEWKAFRSGQKRGVPESNHDQHRVFNEDIIKAERQIAGCEAVIQKLKAWLAEIQPAELSATL